MIKPFENITPKNKEKLLKLLHAYNANYKKNKNIIDSFKDDEEIGIITQGYVQIIRNNYNGTTAIVEELYEDDLIGSVFLYTKNDEYEIITKEETNIIIINHNEINSTDINDKNYNQFIRNLYMITNEKIKEKNERIEILTQKTIRNKLLEYFKISSRKSGSKYIYLPFNFSDLANYLAVDRSAMSREIGYLKEEGFIEIKGKRITLLYR